ncbi:kinase-like domain-containing protein [Crucibulum laeve]|uniref:Kinase-like domain-containing protein n=1 Tax=Crucibulum laeve TaxID=68775 RepID=A0A5C3MCN7_9AGAR|nr:kinase-like domain-containing protein [Crucibulum laeve]
MFGTSSSSSPTTTTTTTTPSSPSSSSSITRRSSSPRSYLPNIMIKLWPTTPSDQLTPRASAHEKNPFDLILPQSPTHHHRFSNPTPTTPTAVHPLLHHPGSPFLPTTSTLSAVVSAHSGSVPSDLTPQAGTPSNFGSFPAAQPTTQLSLHAPVFNMQQPPPGNRVKSSSNMSSTSSSSSSSSSSSPPATSSPANTSKGQLHVKLIQARGLNVRSIHARPYVVVQFEQNEFVSRDPTDETDKEVKGTAVNVSRNTSSNAISALGAIGSKAAAHEASKRGSKGSKDSSPSSSIGKPSTLASSAAPGGLTNGLFGRLSAHNPVWKHEVSFDVTSGDSAITFNVYDRAVSDQGFLGTVQIKPVLIHDHTVDHWYKLLPFENEVVSGEMRVQITFEQYKNKRALTPRDFEFLKLIGRGTFGRVFQVRKKDTKRIYAMKVLSKKEIVAKKEVAHTIGERKILQRSLESPFLVGLKFSFQTDTDLYLVTDFKSGGELFWHLQRETRFTEERARFYIAELILALEHLHKYNIVYRDLKPENILLDATGHVALCDFGLSKADLRPDELTTTFCGTTEYLAPEILLDEQGYSKIVDFWSLGVLLFEMCCGWSPFYAEDTQQMYKNICFGKIRFPKGVINEDGKQFVKGLLNRNPKHRLGAQRDAAELKEHPFFKNIDWDALSRKQITPPFKPVVESDESTNNFDPEFTSADIRDVGLADMDLDDDDPSEAWVSQSIGGNGMVHTPNGPLGSERERNSQSKPTSPFGPLSTMTNGVSMSSHGGGSSVSKSQGIQIQPKKKKKDPAGTPLTNSVQENFRGFTYSGGESVVAPMVGLLGKRDKERDEQAVDDEEVPEVTTEDEFEDVGRSAGRYANARRKGLGFSSMDDDMP